MSTVGNRGGPGAGVKQRNVWIPLVVVAVLLACCGVLVIGAAIGWRVLKPGQAFDLRRLRTATTSPLVATAAGRIATAAATMPPTSTPTRQPPTATPLPPTATPWPPTATSTLVPPTATRTLIPTATATPTLSPTVKPPTLILVTVIDYHYEKWGKPDNYDRPAGLGDCGDYDDNQPVRKLIVHARVRNASGTDAADWHPLAYRNRGARALACYYGHQEGEDLRLRAGQTVEVTFTAYCELGEWISYYAVVDAQLGYSNVMAFPG